MAMIEVEYSDATGSALRGLRLIPDGAAALPGLLLFSDVMGLGDHIRFQAERIAALGYGVFVGDMHGGGVRYPDPSAAFAGRERLLAEPAPLRERAEAALRCFGGFSGVDPSRVAAVGYCFGGQIALELARHGAPLRAVVSFHGDLTPVGTPGIEGDIAVLSYTGSDDQLIPRAQVDAFRTEMEASNCDWQIVVQGGVGHSFTDTGADAYNIPGVGFHGVADRQSFAMLRDLMALRLGSPVGS